MREVYVRNLYGGLRVPVWLMRQAMEAVLRRFGKKGPLNVLFVSPRKIRALNREYAGKDEVTDVLAFPVRGPDDTEETPFGEIYINAKAVLRTAEELKISPNIEAVFLAVHGLLHLVGFSDETPAERRKMIRTQLKIMAELGYHASIVETLRGSLK